MITKNYNNAKSQRNRTSTGFSNQSSYRGTIMADGNIPQKNDAANSSSYKHGHSSWKMPPSPTYNSWRGMLGRCRNPGHASYPNYGGRGIQICSRWLEFKNFLEDMGSRPEGTTLDRIDVDGNYCPENCRWATNAEQARNRNANRILTYNGKSQCLSDWASELGIHPSSLSERLDSGWTLEQALSSSNGSRKKPLYTITYNGLTKTIEEWTKEKGFASSNTIRNRIALGWSIEDIFNKPVRPLKRKSHE